MWSLKQQIYKRRRVAYTLPSMYNFSIACDEALENGSQCCPISDYPELFNSRDTTLVIGSILSRQSGALVNGANMWYKEQGSGKSYKIGTNGVVIAIHYCAEPPSLVPMGESAGQCNTLGGVRVFTSIPVRINMTGYFQTGGSYYSAAGYISSDIVSQEIEENTIYLFGIEGANSGGNPSLSDIVFTIHDVTNGAVLDRYVMYRNHNVTPC